MKIMEIAMPHPTNPLHVKKWVSVQRKRMTPDCPNLLSCSSEFRHIVSDLQQQRKFLPARLGHSDVQLVSQPSSSHTLTEMVSLCLSLSLSHFLVISWKRVSVAWLLSWGLSKQNQCRCHVSRAPSTFSSGVQNFNDILLLPLFLFRPTACHFHRSLVGLHHRVHRSRWPCPQALLRPLPSYGHCQGVHVPLLVF